jgi:hypothetical protein
MEPASIVINGRFKVIEQISIGAQAEILKTLDLNDDKMYMKFFYFLSDYSWEKFGAKYLKKNS